MRDSNRCILCTFRSAAPRLRSDPARSPVLKARAALMPRKEGVFKGVLSESFPYTLRLRPSMLSFRTVVGRDAHARMQNGRFVMTQKLVAFRAGDEGGGRDVARHVKGRAAHIQYAVNA